MAVRSALRCGVAVFQEVRAEGNVCGSPASSSEALQLDRAGNAIPARQPGHELGRSTRAVGSRCPSRRNCRAQRGPACCRRDRWPGSRSRRSAGRNLHHLRIMPSASVPNGRQRTQSPATAAIRGLVEETVAVVPMSTVYLPSAADQVAGAARWPWPKRANHPPPAAGPRSARTS